MSRLSIVSLAALAFVVAGLIVDSSLHAQTAQPVNNIITADGVKLRGTFYENTKPNAPTVIMLHPIGEALPTTIVTEAPGSTSEATAKARPSKSQRFFGTRRPTAAM